MTSTKRHGRPRARKRAVRRGPRRADTPASRLDEAERLYRDFVELTPYEFRPFVKSFSSFAEYQRWRRAQKNPWYR